MHELPYSSCGRHGGFISSHQEDKKNICFVSAILAQLNSTSCIEKTVTFFPFILSKVMWGLNVQLLLLHV